MTEPRYSKHVKEVLYNADINNVLVNIELSHELIENRLDSDQLDENVLVEFVRRNMNIINSEVTHYLREAPDVTGMRIGKLQLRNCHP